MGGESAEIGEHIGIREFDTQCELACAANLYPSHRWSIPCISRSIDVLCWEKLGTQRVVFGLGSVFVIAGIIRQWPILGKTYMEFIEGEGYLSLMLGLIMFVLGFSVPLLLGDEEDS